MTAQAGPREAGISQEQREDTLLKVPGSNLCDWQKGANVCSRVWMRFRMAGVSDRGSGCIIEKWPTASR